MISQNEFSCDPNLPLKKFDIDRKVTSNANHFIVVLFDFLTSSLTTRLYCGRAQIQSVWQFYLLPHMRQSWEIMTSLSASQIILTPTQPVGSGWPQREYNPEPPHQKSRTLPTDYRAPFIFRDWAVVRQMQLKLSLSLTDFSVFFRSLVRKVWGKKNHFL